MRAPWLMNGYAYGFNTCSKSKHTVTHTHLITNHKERHSARLFRTPCPLHMHMCMCM